MAIAKNNSFETRILDPSWHTAGFNSKEYWNNVNKGCLYKVRTVYQLVFVNQDGSTIYVHHLVFLKHEGVLGLDFEHIKDLRVSPLTSGGKPQLYLKDSYMSENLDFSYNDNKDSSYKDATIKYLTKAA